MPDLLFANVRALLRFYARSRLLLALALLMLVIFGLSLLPMVLFDTATSRFESLRQLSSMMDSFTFVFVPVMGLLAVSSHLRQRTLKMVVTKPCPPEAWLLGVFVSAGLVSLALHAAVAAVTAGLSVAWGVPYQTGFLHLAVEGFLESTVALAFLVALTTLLHPVVAVIVILFFSDAIFYQLEVMLAGAQAANWRGGLLPVQALLDVVYTLLPLYDPLGDRGDALRQTMRPEAGDWLRLLLSAGYTIVTAAFFFALSSWALRRRRLT
jgi:ABC-type transport system involved in multi-copper enzyme maturation permease subunit